MTQLIATHSHRRASLIARIFAALALATVAGLSSAAVDPDQSRVAPPPGDGWQILSGTPSAAASGSQVAPPVVGKSVAAPLAASAASVASAPSLRIVAPTGGANASLAVTSVVLPSSGPSATSAGILTLAITPQDINLRNALDRWLQQQGWQLAWKIDDDLPLEFNATFTGDFKSVLTQVMQATNHMRTPTRVCKHTNNVIRVVTRAANCQD
jgi:hypothetical protein